MRKLGTLDPESDFIDHSAIWYLIGYFANSELPDYFFDKYVKRKMSREDMIKAGRDTHERLVELNALPFDEENPHANTRPNR